MRKTLNVGQVKIYIPHDNYCNNCEFKRYVNHSIKYKCMLFRGDMVRDGNNFIRLEACKQAEVPNV